MNHIHCDKSLDAAASFCIGVAQRNLDCNLGTYVLWYFFVQIYFMQRSILLAYVCVPYICSAQGGQKRVSDLLELELMDIGKPPCGYWETNLGSPQEQLEKWGEM